MKLKRKFLGFTLIELMIAMTVIAIGLALTVPAMKNFTDANKKAEQVNKLVGDLAFCKNEATKGQTCCVTNTSGTPVWDGGWTVATAAAPLIPIRTSTTIAVAGQTIASSTGDSTVCFRPNGNLPAGAITISIEQCGACVDVVNREKQINIVPTGRISLNSQFACVPAAPICP